MRAREFIKEEKSNGIDLSMEIQKDDEYVDDDDYSNQILFVKASAGGKELGYVIFAFDGEYLLPQDLEVEERFRGQGIAQTMYDYVKSKGYKIRRSGQQTDAGAGFWAKHRPEQNVWESEESNNIVYHGNQGGIHRELITPMWWTEDRDTAVYYATQFNGDGWIYSAKLTCKNPYVVKPTDETNTLVEKYKTLEQQGYDSIYDPRGHDWIPFHAQDIHLVGEPEYQEGEDVRVWEAFDQPYKTKTEKSEYGDVDMLARLPDGTNLSIMFNNQGDDEWQVEFYRNNSQEVTGEGDAQRVFATVLTSMQKFIKKYKPWRLTFSATKDVEPGKNSESRAKLYNRLVQRYATVWGYEEYAEDHGDQITYELTRLKQGVAEEQLDELSFLGSECTKDCSGHRAGYEWSKRKGLRQANSWSPSFNKGAGLAVAGK